MRVAVSFHRLAAQEYRRAKAWYADRSEFVAERFRDAVGRAIDRIAAEGQSLPVLTGEYRWVRVRQFPYILIFRFRTDDEIIVVAVAHMSRRPGYWRRRK